MSFSASIFSKHFHKEDHVPHGSSSVASPSTPGFLNTRKHPLPGAGGARRLWFAAALACLLLPAAVRAEEAEASAAPSAGSTEPRESGPWGFSGTLGTGGAGGDFGNLFTKPVSWDFAFFKQKGAWRFGVGATFESFKMKDPHQDELEWGFQQIYLSGTRMFNSKGTIRP